MNHLALFKFMLRSHVLQMEKKRAIQLSVKFNMLYGWFHTNFSISCESCASFSLFHHSIVKKFVGVCYILHSRDHMRNDPTMCRTWKKFSWNSIIKLAWLEYPIRGHCQWPHGPVPHPGPGLRGPIHSIFIFQRFKKVCMDDRLWSLL